jgi:hypothetical protein
MYIRQAATVAELMSYIEKIERLDVTAENYKAYLKPAFKDFLSKAGDLGPLIDATFPSQMKVAALKQMRLELFAQAAVLRSRKLQLLPVPAMTEDAAADISVWLRQWCATAMRQEPQSNSSLHETNAIKGVAPMQTLHDSRRAVFINYSHFDNEDSSPKNRWLDRLLQMLRPLVNQEELTHWSDQEIKTGDDWHVTIQAQLEVAKAAVLLVSPAFLASDYIRNSELPVLLKNAAKRGVKIFPIIVRPCLYQRAKFKYPDPKLGPNELMLSSIQSANPPSKALTEMTESEQDRVLLKVATELHELLLLGQSGHRLPAIATQFSVFHHTITHEWNLELQARVIDPNAVEGILTRVRATLIEYARDLDPEQYPAVYRQLQASTLDVTNVLRDNPFKELTMIDADQWMGQAIEAMNSLGKLEELIKRTQWT